MKFTYFQALGMIIFKKSYFELLQANSKANYKQLVKENVELKETELLKRIEALQEIIKSDRVEHRTTVSELYKQIHLKDIHISSNKRTIDSDIVLIKELWQLIQKFKVNTTFSNLQSCKLELKQCKGKIEDTVRFVKKIAKVKRMVLKPIEDVSKETVDTYA